MSYLDDLLAQHGITMDQWRNGSTMNGSDAGLVTSGNPNDPTAIGAQVNPALSNEVFSQGTMSGLSANPQQAMTQQDLATGYTGTDKQLADQLALRGMTYKQWQDQNAANQASWEAQQAAARLSGMANQYNPDAQAQSGGRSFYSPQDYGVPSTPVANTPMPMPSPSPTFTAPSITSPVAPPMQQGGALSQLSPPRNNTYNPIQYISNSAPPPQAQFPNTTQIPIQMPSPIGGLAQLNKQPLPSTGWDWRNQTLSDYLINAAKQRGPG